MIISVINWKGGQGKTTLTFQLSFALSELGFRVLAIDLDGQDLSNAFSREREFSGYLSDYFSHPELDHNLISVRTNNLHYIANERRRSDLAVKLLSSQGREGQERLIDLLSPLDEFYDVIMLDCSPSSSVLSDNAFIASHRILIPAELDIAALEGMVDLIDRVELVRSKGWNRRLQIAGVVLFKPKDRTLIGQAAKVQLDSIIASRLQGKLFNTVIRENTKMKESQALGIPIGEHAKTNRGTEDILSLALELIEREQLKPRSHGKKG